MGEHSQADHPSSPKTYSMPHHAVLSNKTGEEGASGGWPAFLVNFLALGLPLGGARHLPLAFILLAFLSLLSLSFCFGFAQEVIFILTQQVACFYSPHLLPPSQASGFVELLQHTGVNPQDKGSLLSFSHSVFARVTCGRAAVFAVKLLNGFHNDCVHQNTRSH